MKKIVLLLILTLLVPAVSAIELDTPFGDLSDSPLENITVLKEEQIPDANFTSLQNYTFHYENAKKIIYRNDEGKTDYMIVWQCNLSEDYYQLASIHDLYMFYSDYTKDNTSVFYIEEPFVGGESIWGIMLDKQNITYTEKDLVHNILHKSDLALTNENHPQIKQSGGGGYYYEPSHSHYKGPVIDPYETARNDPYSYYDYFDYEDNVDIDEYLYDNGYDE